MSRSQFTGMQRRLAEWQKRRGTLRVLLSVTLISVAVSAILCFTQFYFAYGGIDGMVEALDTAAFVMPILVPLIVAPLVTWQLAGALSVATSLIDELEEAHAELKSEVARREAAQAELERLARCDPLTGLLNRRGFFDALAELDPTSLDALVLTTVDVDQFKAVNDNHGHAFGDRVLCAVGESLATAAGQSAIVARMGGDEFVAALVNGSSALTGVRKALDGVVLEDPTTGTFEVRCSVGAATHSADGSIDVTLAQADVALYQDKPNYRLGSGQTRSSAR